MSKEQIEEMAKDIKRLDEVPYIPNATYNFRRASKLYSIGYRKASEVAREIFEEIDDAVDNLRGAFLRQRISELKKKYIGKEND